MKIIIKDHAGVVVAEAPVQWADGQDAEAAAPYLNEWTAVELPVAGGHLTWSLQAAPSA
jgi:hypothetical protein